MSTRVRSVLIVLTVALSVIAAHRHFASGSRTPAESPAGVSAAYQHEQSCPCGGH